MTEIPSKGNDMTPLYLCMLEYWKLKEEQLKRIGYRDTMIHVQLGAVGAVAAWALMGHGYLSLLVIPWVCVVLGWTYLFNDDRISAIGKYVRQDLSQRIAPPRRPEHG